MAATARPHRELAVENHYTVYQVSVLLALTVEEVRRMLRSGVFRPALKLKREWRIPHSVVLQYIERHRVKP